MRPASTGGAEATASSSVLSLWEQSPSSDFRVSDPELRPRGHMLGVRKSESWV